ncbi:MAG: shikimate dehydrogenase [Oscillospiraceae bacterium]|nr:shikimate dehydrogenase [Oscillospiraceae bacterium]
MIGYPLGHSLSPQIHGELFKQRGIEATYTLCPIEPNELRSYYDKLDKFDGFNVTIPYKKEILDYCASLSSDAAYFGAVNCVKDRVGYNTDVIGLRLSVEALGANLKGRVLLLGYGGAGVMAAKETLRQGGDLTVAVRDATKVPHDLNAVTFDQARGEYDLIINTTPAGMSPNINLLPDGLLLTQVEAAHVLDIIYNPKETLLLQKMRERGSKTLNGELMLLEQAKESQRLWLD